MENGNGECVKKTTTRPSLAKRQNSIGFQRSKKNPASGGVLQLTPTKMCTSSVIMDGMSCYRPKFTKGFFFNQI